MAILPRTSAVPDPGLAFMPGTSPAPVPAPTPLPPSAPAGSAPPPSPSSSSSSSSAPGPPPDEGADFPLPTLRLEVRDLAHPGAGRFLSSVDPAALLPATWRRVLRLLYVRPGHPGLRPPPTRSVTVVLRDMPGVAYTAGTDLDRDHKEVHLSLGYVAGLAAGRAAAAAEVGGVLAHELVHCCQWDARGSCPGGLVEGVADWVRLRCGLAPPHWRREAAGPWDRGYQHTAYFLDYLEARFGDGTVRRVNDALRTGGRYDEKQFWTRLLGRPVEQLWGDYVDSVPGGDGGDGGDGGESG